MTEQQRFVMWVIVAALSVLLMIAAYTYNCYQELSWRFYKLEKQHGEVEQMLDVDYEGNVK